MHVLLLLTIIFIINSSLQNRNTFLYKEELFKTIDNRDCSYKNTAILKSLGQVTLLRYIRIRLCNKADRINHKHVFLNIFFDHCAFSGMYNFSRILKLSDDESTNLFEIKFIQTIVSFGIGNLKIYSTTCWKRYKFKFLKFCYFMLRRDSKSNRFICKFIINEIIRTVKVRNDLLRVCRGLHLTSLYLCCSYNINVLNKFYSKLRKNHLYQLKQFAKQKYQVDFNYALIIK